MKTDSPTHTPGPWGAVGSYPVSITSESDGDTCIAVIEEAGGYEALADQRRANASLIAASPDLLSACKALLKELEWWTKEHQCCAGHEEEAIEAARAAIAKAEPQP